MGICPASPLPRGGGLKRPEEREKSTIKPDSAPAAPLSHTATAAPRRGPYRIYRHIKSGTSPPGPPGPAPVPLSPLTFRRRPPSPAPLRGSSAAAPAPRQAAAAGGGGREGGRERRCDARRGKWLKRRGRAGGGAGRARGRARPLCSPGRRREERARTCCWWRRLPASGSGRAGNAAGCPRCAAGLRRGGRAAPPARAEEKLPPCGAGRAAPGPPSPPGGAGQPCRGRTGRRRRSPA